MEVIFQRGVKGNEASSTLTHLPGGGGVSWQRLCLVSPCYQVTVIL